VSSIVVSILIVVASIGFEFAQKIASVSLEAYFDAVSLSVNSMVLVAVISLMLISFFTTNNRFGVIFSHSTFVDRSTGHKYTNKFIRQHEKKPSAFMVALGLATCLALLYDFSELLEVLFLEGVNTDNGELKAVMDVKSWWSIRSLHAARLVLSLLSTFLQTLFWV